METKKATEKKNAKIKLISAVTAVVLAAAVCAVILLRSPEKEPVVTDLGIPTAETYFASTSPRNPWDMIAADGSLYVGAGDYASNSGPTSIWRYDTEGEEWSVSSVVQDEAVSKFVTVGDDIMTPGIDPTTNNGFGNYHRLRGTEWETYDTLPDGMHNYDIALLGGKMFFGIGTVSSDTGLSPVKLTTDGEAFEDVPFYRDGEPINSADSLAYFRVYDFFATDETLYCILCARQASGSIEWSFYKYGDEKFTFVSSFSDHDIATERFWMDTVGSKAVLGGTCFFTTGYLYKTEDFTSVEALTVPDGGFVTDLLVENDIMYILSAKENEDGWQNTIWKYSADGDMESVASFSAGTSALSFAKSGNTFFAGLGNYSGGDEETGKILKIEL